MPFAQKNYPQPLGNSQLTLAEAGCFVTAFSNGLETINGSGPDPATLNQFFIDHGIYSYDAADHANDDVSWNSISSYDPSIVVSQVGVGSLPPSSQAIVKFHYNSVHTGYPIDHFCWVHHIDGDQVFIVDSWDGQVKGPSGYEGVYHKPIAWATYVKNSPPPAPEPAPAPKQWAAAPVTSPSTERYEVVKSLKGYRTANNAVNHLEPFTDVPAGSYYMFNRHYDMINVTSTLGQPGAWINPGDNVFDPPPPPPPVPEPTPTPTLAEIKKDWEQSAPVIVEPTVTPPTPVKPDWRTTYSPMNPERTPIFYVALRDYTVRDVAGQSGDKPLKRGWRVPISGTFMKDGIIYGRPVSKSPTRPWYGIPLSVSGRPLGIIEPEEDVFDGTTTLAERQALHTANWQDRVSLVKYGIEKFIEDVVNHGKAKTKK